MEKKRYQRIKCFEEGKRYGTQFTKLLPEQKLRFVQTANKWLGEFFQKNTDISTKAGKLVLGAHGMGQMMATMEASQVGVETLNDWRALIKNPNAAPGKGQFENYDTNKSFLSNIHDRLPNRMLSAYIN